MLRCLNKWKGVIATPRPFRQVINQEQKIEAT